MPRPILSDWEDFTSSMIDSAFGKTFEYKKNILYVIRITRESISENLTPREIKTFINQLGVLWINCDDEIPIESIAYYVILRYVDKSKVTDIQKKIVDGSISNLSYINLLPQTIVMDLSGLSYGVSAKIGQQLLLEPVVIEELRSHEDNKLKELIKIHENGFWFVFNYQIDTVSMMSKFSFCESIYKELWKDYKEDCKSIIIGLSNSKLQLFQD